MNIQQIIEAASDGPYERRQRQIWGFQNGNEEIICEIKGLDGTRKAKAICAALNALPDLLAEHEAVELYQNGDEGYARASRKMFEAHAKAQATLEQIAGESDDNG